MIAEYQAIIHYQMSIPTVTNRMRRVFVCVVLC